MPCRILWGDQDRSYRWPQVHALWKGVPGAELPFLAQAMPRIWKNPTSSTHWCKISFARHEPAVLQSGVTTCPCRNCSQLRPLELWGYSFCEAFMPRNLVWAQFRQPDRNNGLSESTVCRDAVRGRAGCATVRWTSAWAKNVIILLDQQVESADRYFDASRSVSRNFRNISRSGSKRATCSGGTAPAIRLKSGASESIASCRNFRPASVM